MRFSITELLLIAGLVILLFGGKRLRHLGGDLGSALRDFKKGLQGESSDPTDPTDKNKPDKPEQLEQDGKPQKPPRDE